MSCCGKRINRSVFECMVTDSQYEKLIHELTVRIDSKTDKIVIYRVCLDCYADSCILPYRKKNIQRVKII